MSTVCPPDAYQHEPNAPTHRHDERCRVVLPKPGGCSDFCSACRPGWTTPEQCAACHICHPEEAK